MAPLATARTLRAASSHTTGGPAATAALTAAVAVVVLVLLVAGAPVYTDDLWWHLTAGETYLREGLWPAVDGTLHTGREAGPVQHEWLFGVVVNLVERAVGFPGLRVLHAAAVALILVLAWSAARRAAPGPAFAALVLSAFAMLAAPRLAQLRPDLVSIAAVLIGHRLLVEAGGTPDRGRVLVFALLVGLWANMHSLFMVGVNLVFAALLGVALERAIAHRLPGARAPDPAARARMHAFALAIVCALLAAAVNPRGFAQHLTFFTSTEGAAIWHVTDEWSTFNPILPGANHATVGLAAWLTADAVLLAFVLAAGLRARALVVRRDAETLARLDPVHLGLALAGIVAALVSIRFLWLLIFPALYAARALPRGRQLAAGEIGAAAAALALAAALCLGPNVRSIAVRFAGAPADYLLVPYRSHKYHAEGVHFLQATELEGNLFNAYWMGGFLGYWLSPRMRTFIDGRTEHYEVSVFEDYSALLGMGSTREGEFFPDILDRRGVDVHFGVGFPGWWLGVYTTPHLERMPGWILVSRSYRHAIHVRALPRNAELLARVAHWYRAQGVPYDPAMGLEPGRVITERPDWAIAHAMVPPSYLELVAARGAEDAATRAGALERLGVLYLLNGAYDEAIAVESERLALDEVALEPRLRLAFALLKLDRLEEGRAESERALAAAPDDPRVERLARAVGVLERLRDGLVPAQRGVPERTFISRTLWRAIPLAAEQTWPLEHAIDTERFALERPRPDGDIPTPAGASSQSRNASSTGTE